MGSLRSKKGKPITRGTGPVLKMLKFEYNSPAHLILIISQLLTTLQSHFKYLEDRGTYTRQHCLFRFSKKH